MALQITLVKTPAKVSVSKTSQTFHKQGGTLGRGQSNAWVLPDPDKFLSSCHCELLFDANKYYLLDLSTNGTFFNNSPEPLGKGAKSPLSDGDVFDIGEYRFSVKLLVDQGFAGASPFAVQKTAGAEGIFANPGAPGTAQSGFALPNTGGGFLPPDFHLGISSQGVDPVALWGAVQTPKNNDAKNHNSNNNKINDSNFNNLGPSVTGSMFDPVTGAITPQKSFGGPTVDNTPNVNQAITWPGAAPESLIPEDWGDIDLIAPTPTPPPVRPSPVTPFSEPAPTAGLPLNWDDDFNLMAAPPIAQAPPAQPFAAPPFAEPPVAQAPKQVPAAHQRPAFPDPLEPDAFNPGRPEAYPQGFAPQDVFAQTPPAATPPVAPPRPQVPEQVPQINVKPVAPAIVPQQMHVPQGAPNHRLIAAMGLDSQRLSAEQMDEISDKVGELMRETVSGMMQVLRSRTSIKNEFRMNVTTIQSAENNPLKFSVSVEDALENMFIKKSNAYKKPVEAFREGFQEIGEHQVAMIAGIRQGFDKMMQRFEPGLLEHTFDKQGKSSIIPGLQKTKYWTSYREHYAGFVDNMESSFQHLFGSDFVNAYEDQLRKLAAARKKK